MRNIFTVDLEDWYLVNENDRYNNFQNMNEYRENLHSNVRTILSLLKRKNIKATFFVLGKLAETEPEIVNEIYSNGHEIACHGYNHKRVSEMTQEEFKRDLELSIKVIQKVCGITPKGYRAANFSINKNNLWSLFVLKEFGFAYDSSIYPIKYYSEFKRNEINMSPYVHESGIIEFPLSCIEIIKYRIPFSGGAYFRFIPFNLFCNFIKKINKQGRELIFYIHPWELNNSFPISSVSGLSKLRKFYNINKVESRLKSMVDKFDFYSIEEYIINNFSKNYSIYLKLIIKLFN